MNICKTDAACMGRREFLVKAALVASGTLLTVSAAGSAFANSFEDITIDLAADGPLAKIGGWEIVDSSAGKLIVINEGDGKFVAFSAKCTHKGATLEYDAAGKKLSCPKHGSAFDRKTGAVANGPADEPLGSFPAKTADKKVLITVP